jgi:hypothetical protein
MVSYRIEVGHDELLYAHNCNTFINKHMRIFMLIFI